MINWTSLMNNQLMWNAGGEVRIWWCICNKESSSSTTTATINNDHCEWSGVDWYDQLKVGWYQRQQGRAMRGYKGANGKSRHGNWYRSKHSISLSDHRQDLHFLNALDNKVFHDDNEDAVLDWRWQYSYCSTTATVVLCSFCGHVLVKLQ